MSWKIDALALGGLGIGAYFVFVNRDKIMSWLGEQVFNPFKEAYEKTGQDIGATIGGATTGETGEIVGGAIGAGNQYVTGNPIIAGISGGIAGTIWPLFVNPFAPKPVELPKTIVVDGQGYSGTPEFLTKKAAESSISAPFNPGLNVLSTQKVAVSSPSPASTPTPAPTGTQKIGLTAEQRYAQTFAMPGSPAWIAAGLK